MFFATVVAPTVIFAATHEQHLFREVDAMNQSRQHLQSRHYKQEQFIRDFVSFSGSLLGSWQTPELEQPAKQQKESECMVPSREFQSHDSEVMPTARIRSHPTQSDLVQRFANFITPFSMATIYASCQSEDTKTQ